MNEVDRISETLKDIDFETLINDLIFYNIHSQNNYEKSFIKHLKKFNKEIELIKNNNRTLNESNITLTKISNQIKTLINKIKDKELDNDILETLKYYDKQLETLTKKIS